MKIDDINFGQACEIRSLVYKEQKRVSSTIQDIIDSRDFTNYEKEKVLKHHFRRLDNLEELYKMFVLVTNIENNIDDEERVNNENTPDT